MLRLKISRDRFYLSPEFSIFRTIEKGVSVTIINIERIDSKNILSNIRQDKNIRKNYGTIELLW